HGDFVHRVLRSFPTRRSSDLDFVKEHVAARRLWTAPASDVIRYRRAREVCPLPTVSGDQLVFPAATGDCARYATALTYRIAPLRSEEHTSELQSRENLVCRLL